jgi:hypothetical protein
MCGLTNAVLRVPVVRPASGSQHAKLQRVYPLQLGPGNAAVVIPQVPAQSAARPRGLDGIPNSPRDVSPRRNRVSQMKISYPKARLYVRGTDAAPSHHIRVLIACLLILTGRKETGSETRPSSSSPLSLIDLGINCGNIENLRMPYVGRP